MLSKPRCEWVTSDPIYINYHDHEWGVPVHDDQQLFEMLQLEGMQAGLSWLTVLKKRDALREVFSQFDPHRIAAYKQTDVDRLLADSRIIRHRLKIESVITNARAYCDLSQTISLNDWLWDFVDHQPIQNHWQTHQDVPNETALSKRLSASLKKLGFRFVGPTICYAFMQAIGMVQDHTIDCFCYRGGS